MNQKEWVIKSKNERIKLLQGIEENLYRNNKHLQELMKVKEVDVLSMIEEIEDHN